MKRSEIATFLGMVAATDRRTVGDLDVQTWQVILPDDITLNEAQAALIHHRKTCTDWLEPKHIVDLVDLIRRDHLDPERRERLRRAGVPPVPDGLTWAQEKEFRKGWCALIKDGASKDEAAALTRQQMGLPVEITAPERKAELNAFIDAGSRSFAMNRAHPTGGAA